MSTFMKIGNFFIRMVLSSPLHGMMSKNTLLVHFTGWKSGKQYTTPVNYTQEGAALRITSQRDRVWWRNLKHNPDITLTLRGKRAHGTAAVLEDPDTVAASLERFLRPIPHMARYYQIGVTEDGSFDPTDLQRAAQNTVVIEIILDPL
jgi:deazaflavin-dependent oxidoreductase (nitroreductase family)